MTTTNHVADVPQPRGYEALVHEIDEFFGTIFEEHTPIVETDGKVQCSVG